MVALAGGGRLACRQRASKPAELAVAAGSAFIIRTERTVVTSDIQRLSSRGVGLRRHEGFGDLAGPPCLRDGMEARLARQRHARRRRDAVAPLLGLSVRFPGRWPELRSLLAAHVAAGAAVDANPARRLRQAADEFPDRAIADALRAFLSLPASDAAAVAEELGRL